MVDLRQATEQDFRRPEFIGKDPEDYEIRLDGACVRKDRWEMAVQRIRELVDIHSSADWEISDVIDAVEKIANEQLRRDNGK